MSLASKLIGNSGRFGRWKGPVAFGLIEQALLSGVNFAFTAFMAHRLGIEEFGWLSIAWAILLFMEAGSQGLFGDAVPASARRLPRSAKAEFRGAFLTLSFCYSMAMFVLALFLWGAAQALGLKEAVLIPATALAFISLRAQNAGRRLYYLDGHRKEAALAAVVNVAAMSVGALLLLYLAQINSAAVAMMLACFANTLSAVLIFLQRQSIPIATPSRKMLDWAKKRLWSTGRWLLASSSMSWLGNFGLIVIVGALVGVKASGTLRVVMTLTLPPAQLVIVLMSIIVPRVAAMPRREAAGREWQLAIYSIALIGAITSGYALLMTVAGNWLPHMLFGAPAKSITALTVGLATFGYALESVRYGCNVVLLSRGDTKILTVGQTAALGSAMIFVPIAAFHGIDWVVAATTVSNNINTLVIFVFFILNHKVKGLAGGRSAPSI